MSKFPEKILSFSFSSENKACSHCSVPLNAVATRAMSRDQDSRDTSKETYQDLISNVFNAVVSCAPNLFSTNLAMRGFEVLHVSVTNSSHIQGIISLSTHTACYRTYRPQFMNYVHVVSINT